MAGRRVLRRLGYALYMAAFITAVTATFAAFFTSYIVALSFRPQWIGSFLIIFLGGYAVARIRFLPFRALIVAVASMIASLYMALPPLGPHAPNFHEYLAMAEYLVMTARSRLFLLAGGVETLILALGAEILLKLLSRMTERSRKAKPLPG